MLYLLIVTLITARRLCAEQDFFLEKPENKTGLLGEDVTLRCSADPTFLSPETIELKSQWKSSDGSMLGDQEEGRLDGYGGRYYYLSRDKYEKNLMIKNLTLKDDGLFECQMTHVIRGKEPSQYRAKAYVTVLVAPTEVVLVPYRKGTVLDVNEDSKLSISCEARNAKPAAALKWFTDGRLIEETVHRKNAKNSNSTVTSYATLSWIPKRFDNNRTFTCHSVHTETKSVADLEVTLNVIYPSEKPKVGIKGKYGSVKAGDNVTLSCTVRGGNPLPELKWYHKNSLMSSKFHYNQKMQETTNDYPMVVGPEHNGLDYECRSSNAFSSDPLKTFLHLSVKYAASNVHISGSNRVRANHSARFLCSSGSANPPANIEWLVNGISARARQSKVTDSSRGSITESVLNVIPAEYNYDNHELIVECIAGNDVGSARDERHVTILSPPGEPVIAAVSGIPLDNGVVNFTCTTSGGNPLANLSWYLSHHKLSSARTTVKGDSVQTVESFLTLRVNRSTHHQKLRCEAGNEALDHPRHAEYVLNVYFPPRSVTIEQVEQNYHLRVGNKSRLVCRSRASNPEAEIGWEFPEMGDAHFTVEKRNNGNGGFDVENIIEFIPTRRMDKTAVACFALSSKWARVNSSVFVLNVQYTPQVLNMRKTIVMREGQWFNTNFTVDANPVVFDYNWKKDGVSFYDRIGSLNAKGANLASTYLSASDSGTYELALSNEAGTTNIVFELVVQHSARITKISGDKIVLSGEKVILECAAVGVPRSPNMTQWLHENSLVTQGISVDDEYKNLTFSASKSMSGTFACITDNGVGEGDRREVRVLVHMEPLIYKDAMFRRAAGTLGRSARIKCRARGVPEVKFSWYFVGSSNEIQNSAQYTISIDSKNYPDYESTLLINKLDRSHYERPVKCIAKNSLGKDSLSVKIGPLSAPEVPTKLSRVSSTKSSVTVKWTPGFDGGSKQHFELRCRSVKEEIYRSSNTSEQSFTFEDLLPAEQYEIAVRSWNADGYVSSYSSPIVAFTRNAKGEDMQMVMQKANSFSTLLVLLLGLGVFLLLFVNCILFCYMHKRQKRKKIQEKTEMVRKLPDGTGDSKAIHMYGALVNSENACRPESANTNRSELVYERASEDEQSMRTIIEVNPNGCVEELGQNGCYDRGCMVEYDFESISSVVANPYGDVVRPGTLRRPVANYTNIPYPDPFGEEVSIGASSTSYSPGIISRRSVDAPLLGSPRRQRFIRNSEQLRSPNLQSVNNNSALMSTFVRSQPGPLLTTPLNYANIDGDLV